MSGKVRIEYMNQFGEWQRYTTVSAFRTNIRAALQRAIRVQACAGKARAVDEATGAVVDMEVSG
jgi:hypothetical protein